MTLGQWLVGVGASLIGLGGGLGIAYFTYTLEAAISFWAWPGIVAVCVTALGALLMLIALKAREAGVPNQVQRSGHSSRNYQAGGDISVGLDKEE